jgi:hypothetical protein
MELAGLILGSIAVIGGLAVVPLPFILHHRHERRKREMEHIERMRALELGRTLPQDEPWWSPLRIALLIGVGVPIGFVASVGLAGLAIGYHETMWFMAGMVGMSGVICGSILAGQSINPKTAPQVDASKPYVEEDAYDVVGARG